MWPWSKKKVAVPNDSLRETLFRDIPLSTWAADGSGEPWASFSSAAYEDRRARYINFSGAVILWEASDSRMEGHIEEPLSAGRKLASLIGPCGLSYR